MLRFFSKKTKGIAPDIDSPVKILGAGCVKCDTLAANTQEALRQLGSPLEVSHITDYATIASYGVMGTPGLVYERKVLVAGTVLSVEKIVELLRPLV